MTDQFREYVETTNPSSCITDGETTVVGYEDDSKALEASLKAEEYGVEDTTKIYGAGGSRFNADSVRVDPPDPVPLPLPARYHGLD